MLWSDDELLSQPHPLLLKRRVVDAGGEAASVSGAGVVHAHKETARAKRYTLLKLAVESLLPKG